MAGFRNAQSVTKFAVGMAFSWKGKLCTVLETLSDDTAAVREYMNSRLEWVGTSILHECTLDLDSVWVGRKYKGRPGTNWGEDKIGVLSVACGYVGFDDRAFTDCWTLADFHKVFEPLPLESSEPKPEPPADPTCQQLGEIRERQEAQMAHTPESSSVDEQFEREFRTVEAWPKVGEECECRFSIPRTWKRVKVVAVHEYEDGSQEAWVVQEGHGILVGTYNLRPLPHEPPVKEGDYVEVRTKSGKEIIIVGAVTWVDDTHFIVNHKHGKYGFGEFPTTRLVPDTLYTKMKKRLEELRDEQRLGGIIPDLYRSLLSDLEAYAKE